MQVKIQAVEVETTQIDDDGKKVKAKALMPAEPFPSNALMIALEGGFYVVTIAEEK